MKQTGLLLFASFIAAAMFLIVGLSANVQATDGGSTSCSSPLTDTLPEEECTSPSPSSPSSSSPSPSPSPTESSDVTQNYYIRGIVRDTVGNPVPGATVTCEIQDQGSGFGVETNQNGAFECDVTTFSPNTFRVIAWREVNEIMEYGWVENITVPPTVDNVAVTIKPFDQYQKQGKIVGNVKFPDGVNENLAGHTVELYSKAPLLDVVTRTTTTDNLGNYSFTDLPVGDYQVTITGPTVDESSYWCAYYSVFLSEGETATRSDTFVQCSIDR